jgi:hypothetical protein
VSLYTHTSSSYGKPSTNDDIHTRIYAYVCIHTCGHTPYIHSQLYIHTNTSSSYGKPSAINTRIYAYTCIHTCVHTITYIHTNTQLYIHIHKYQLFLWQAIRDHPLRTRDADSASLFIIGYTPIILDWSAPCAAVGDAFDRQKKIHAALLSSKYFKRNSGSDHLFLWTRFVCVYVCMCVCVYVCMCVCFMYVVNISNEALCVSVCVLCM